MYCDLPWDPAWEERQPKNLINIQSPRNTSPKEGRIATFSRWKEFLRIYLGAPKQHFFDKKHFCPPKQSFSPYARLFCETSHCQDSIWAKGRLEKLWAKVLWTCTNKISLRLHAATIVQCRVIEQFRSILPSGFRDDCLVMVRWAQKHVASTDSLTLPIVQHEVEYSLLSSLSYLGVLSCGWTSI